MKKFILLFLVFLIAITGCKNSKRQPIRGFMIDAARDVEKMEYYYRLVDFYSEKGFNTIIFRLTDDEGCAIRFTSHPELITHPGAYSRDEMKKFIAYAQSKNIEIIPEIESFGHSKYIINTDRYRFLNDAPKDSTAIAWKNALCPVSDTTLLLMKDLYTEVASLFPSPYLHIGCDEIQWGATEMSKEALKTRTKNQIWSDYVNTLNGYVKDLGKKTIIWGDVIINEEPELQDMLQKDIVIMDWDYWDNNDQKIDSIAHVLLNKGFQIIGAPAANWFLWGPRVGAYQLENILSYSRVYHKIEDPKNLGLIVTHWCPKRFIQNCQWDTYELVADIINDPSSFKMDSSLKHFTERHYGANWNSQWDSLFAMVYKYTPKHRYASQLHPGYTITGMYPWSSINEIRENILNRDEPVANPFPGIIQNAMQLQSSVMKNKNDYTDFLLTLQLISHIYDRDNMMWNICHTKKIMKSDVTKTLKEWSAKDNAWVNRLDSAWKTGRTAKMDSTHVWAFPWAANYTKILAENPNELMTILKK